MDAAGNVGKAITAPTNRQVLRTGILREGADKKGIGIDVSVSYNPDSLPIRRTRKSFVGNEMTPNGSKDHPAVTLGHELIHALHKMQGLFLNPRISSGTKGILPFNTERIEYLYVDGSGNWDTSGAKLEENVACGFPRKKTAPFFDSIFAEDRWRWKNGLPTENDLREEIQKRTQQMLGVRNAYHQ